MRTLNVRFATLALGVASCGLVLPGLDLRKARCHVTDMVRTYTEVPLASAGKDRARLFLQPNSFALVEW